MYGILVLCLLSRPMAYSSEINTMNVEPPEGFDERQARDGEYMGCYPQECLEVGYHKVLLEPTTPDSCTAACKENGFIFAVLYNRTECACSCEKTCRVKLQAQPDAPYTEYCGLPCRNHSDMFSGIFIGASFYLVISGNTWNSKCGEKNTSLNELNKEGEQGEAPLVPRQIYIAAGIGSAVFIFLIIFFACLRKRDRRVVYSPRNHSRRWRARAPSQENEERPPNDQQTTSNPPRLPPRTVSCTHQSSSVESTSHKQIRRDGGPTIAEDFWDNMPVAESGFYHVLTEENDEETCSQGLPLATENAYAYADCRSYMKSFPRSAAFIQRQADTPPYHENNEEVEHEMVNNELYAISKK